MKMSSSISAKVVALLLPVALMANFSAYAASPADSPVGLWRTIDDRTGKPRSLIRIIEHDGTFQGVIEKGLGPNDQDDAVCDKCPGQRKGQPLRGMAIVTGLVPSGDQAYSGGEILDPDEGKVYKCKITLKENGSKLDVRGYIGVSLFGRTQTWLRVE